MAESGLSLRTLAELEELHARVARLESMWDKITNAASAVKNAIAGKKSPTVTAKNILDYAASKHVGDDHRVLNGPVVELTINGKTVKITARDDGSILIERDGSEPAAFKTEDDVKKQLDLFQRNTGTASAADIRAYSAAVRLQQACRPSPRAALC